MFGETKWKEKNMCLGFWKVGTLKEICHLQPIFGSCVATKFIASNFVGIGTLRVWATKNFLEH